MAGGVSLALLALASSLVGGHPCREEIERQLASWHATDEVLRAPAGPFGGDVFRIATPELGVWLTLHLPRGQGVLATLFRTDETGTTGVDFGESCVPVGRGRASAPPRREGEKDFTDDDLRALLGKGRPLVVFHWSPHLPLSADGFHEIAKAAEALGVPFVAVVDPSSEADFVDRVADRRGIPVAARRKIGSVELLFRDLTVHAPSIVVFAHDEVSPTLPGYRNAEAYRRYIIHQGRRLQTSRSSF